jgi:hypothetical protein
MAAHAAEVVARNAKAMAHTAAVSLAARTAEEVEPPGRRMLHVVVRATVAEAVVEGRLGAQPPWTRAGRRPHTLARTT